MRPQDLVRAAVCRVPPYRLVLEEAPVKLNQNESPYDVPAEIKEEVFARLRARPWNRYAQRAPARVAELLAARNDWPAEGVVLGAGSNFLLEVLTFGAVRPGELVAYGTPGFALYPLLARLAEAEPLEIPFGPAFAYDVAAWRSTLERHRPALAFLCVPSNPTGSYIGRDGVEAIAGATDRLVVLDEAYSEFAGEGRRDLLAAFPNLVLARTFSKAFSAAGIRLGYLLAHPDLAAELRKLVPPFNINILTATAAEVMLENPRVWEGRVAEIVSERDRIMPALGAVPGVEVFPSRANFFLLRTGRDAGGLAAELEKRGILVRVLVAPGLERCIRVNVGAPAENDRLLAAVREIVGGGR